MRLQVGEARATPACAGSLNRQVLDTACRSRKARWSLLPEHYGKSAKVFWSVNNLPASGDRKFYQTGTTFRQSRAACPRAIYVLEENRRYGLEYDACTLTSGDTTINLRSVATIHPAEATAISQRVDRRTGFRMMKKRSVGHRAERSNHTDSSETCRHR